MFVRYRKLKSDGFEPQGVAAKIACAGACQRRARHQCPMKPRCRWRIGLGEDVCEIIPYRLQVSIAHNHREGGKVRQERVADLGSVEEYLLPAFWGAADADFLAKVRADNWDLHSVRARVRFWEAANRRLLRLVNRLDPKAFRLAVHQQIPWPKEDERELVEARQDFRLWSGLHEHTDKMIKGNQELIEHATEQISELREQGAREAAGAARAAERIAKVTAR